MLKFSTVLENKKVTKGFLFTCLFYLENEGKMKQTKDHLFVWDKSAGVAIWPFWNCLPVIQCFSMLPFPFFLALLNVKACFEIIGAKITIFHGVLCLFRYLIKFPYVVNLAFLAFFFISIEIVTFETWNSC